MKTLKRVFICLMLLFALANTLIAIHIYKFTHVVDGAETLSPDVKLSFGSAIKLFFTGIDFPRATNTELPSGNYKEIIIDANTENYLHAWLIPTDTTKQGIVLILHGYMDNKSSMLSLAKEFNLMGYDALLVDFMGTGKSYGNQTTMGYLEADNVHASYNYIVDNLKENNILIYGFSMGAVATMKALADYQMDVKSVILQAPYATLEGTIGARVTKVNMPQQPLASIITFWMGKINGFDSFDARPIDDAQKITVPTLIMCGMQDPHIPQEETEAIFEAIGTSKKTLQLFQNSKHESLLIQHPTLWRETVEHFLNRE